MVFPSSQARDDSSKSTDTIIDESTDCILSFVYFLSETKPCPRDISYLSNNGSTIAQNFSLINRNKVNYSINFERFLLKKPVISNTILKRGKTNAGASSGPKNPSSSHLKKLSTNESIISMLLKLYSNFSTNIDSFNPENIHLEEINNRIGDGAAFIAKVLKRITILDDFCR